MEVDTTAPEPVKALILQTGATDGESLKVSKIQNDKRAESRKKIKEAGMNTTAYGMGVKVAKMMLNQGEREDFIRDFLITVETLTQKQVEFWPDLAMIAEKRRAKAAEKKARAAAAAGKETPEQQERRVAADTNPRSDPKRGGAANRIKPKKGDAVDRALATSAARNGEGETGDELIARVAREKQAEQEQREGEAVLSQSERAAKKREAAGLN
jgi:hypothetical protein